MGKVKKINFGSKNVAIRICLYIFQFFPIWRPKQVKNYLHHESADRSEDKVTRGPGDFPASRIFTRRSYRANKFSERSCKLISRVSQPRYRRSVILDEVVSPREARERARKPTRKKSNEVIHLSCFLPENCQARASASLNGSSGFS